MAYDRIELNKNKGNNLLIIIYSLYLIECNNLHIITSSDQFHIEYY